MSVKDFNDRREEIRLLALERVRSAPEDARALVTGETRLKSLYEEYQVGGGTPPAKLAADLSALRGEGQKLIRLRAAGRAPAADPAAARVLQRRWDLHLAERDALRDAVRADQRADKSESAVYWSALRAFDRLAERAERELLHNTPPDERSLAEALRRERSELLLALEATPRKTRGPVKVVVPETHAPAITMDPSAFFRFVDQLPDTRPLSKGAWTIPPGARSVTERWAGVRLVARAAGGQGVAYVGAQEVEFQYGYLAVPAETAFYFENTGGIPLVIEFVGIKP